MEKLSYSTGLKEFEVEGGTIRFSPTDTAFANRLYTTFEALAQKQDDVEQQASEDPVEMFKAIEAREAEMRACIDGVFGPGACEKIFPGIGLYAISDGLPVWANFLFAVIELMETSAADEQSKGKSRMELLRKKYGKYMKKK